LALYQRKDLDFSDALLAIKALQKGPKIIHSFDHHLHRVEGLTVIKPA